ncbi:hypothetical protein A3K74_00745 [Candidatus Pacearchaeota archaeon RBG_13_33_26]|nr:MAG: hypothetical protein A3K74_00745 [Candidatus Pacearchaeota archaeon RBG_13_33_26]
MTAMEDKIDNIKEAVFKEKKIANEFKSLFNYFKNTRDEQEKKMVNSQIEKLRVLLINANDELLKNLDEITIKKTLGVAVPAKEIKKRKIEIPERKIVFSAKSREISELDREILKRLKKKRERIVEKKEKKPNQYIQLANNLFSDFTKSLIKERKLVTLERDLIRSNLGYTPATYISVLILTTILAAAASFVIFVFLLFFSISPTFPIITRAADGFGIRLLKTFWILFVIPAGTFLFMYLYPSLEKKSIENKINQELPFATIHMAAISGSMIEPTKIFSIISSTKEYPNLEREFNKLLNEINIYGYDLVTALKDLAINSPSQKLGELFNGLATTITSGGDLYEFFDKRSNSMLFEYRLDKEKRTKTAETFMDIYISVVIAAPMILMLLLMMMKISGFGVSLSTSMITLLVVGGVSLINTAFMIFLQLKQTTTA